MKLHHELAVELRVAARVAGERSLVKICKAYMRGDANDAERKTLADACWRLLGKDVQP